MNENELRSKIVAKAKSYLGTVKGDSNHKHIVDVYNGHTPLARGYKVTYSDSWCATFVSAIFIECGLTDLLVTECGCGEMVNKNASHFVENDAYAPKPGDIVMYDWQDSGSGDNQGWPDHTGIVEKIENGVITVIEGNYSKSVKRREIQVNGTYIRGFITPDYASIATKEEPKQTTSSTPSTPSTTPKYVGRVTASALNVRTGPGTKFENYSPWPQLGKGNLVDVCDEQNGWLYIRIVKSYGSNYAQTMHFAWVSKNYIEKV